MNDSNIDERTNNAVGYLFAILGMVVSVVAQMVYFNFFGLINWLDAIVPGVIAGACVLFGFKIGKGICGKKFPVSLVLIAAVAVILGFLLGITFLIYNISELTLGEAFFVFFDEFLFADLQGGTLYHSQGLIDFAVATGLAILIVCGKHIYDQA